MGFAYAANIVRQIVILPQIIVWPHGYLLKSV